MAKFTTALVIAALLLLSFTLASASRPGPATVPGKTKLEGGEDTEQRVNVGTEESCGGVEEEECLMRRELAAHTDYIYTQKQNP